MAQSYDGSSLPLLAGYVGLGTVSLVIVVVTEKGRLFGRGAGVVATSGTRDGD